MNKLSDVISVFIDTNVLYRADSLRINIEDAIDVLFTEQTELLIHPYVEAEVIDSLTKEGKVGRQAIFAMEFMSNFSPYLDDREYSGTDTALLISAKRENGVVFTFDRLLKKRCQAVSIPVISKHRKGLLRVFGHDFR